MGLGPKTKEFEDRFAKYVNVPHAVGVDSATPALHLALKVLGGGKHLIKVKLEDGKIAYYRNLKYFKRFKVGDVFIKYGYYYDY